MNFDNLYSDNQNNDDEEPIYHKSLYFSSITDANILKLIPDFIEQVINSFKIRYYSSDNDAYFICMQTSRVQLYNYIYDEFIHVLQFQKFKLLKNSGISQYDSDKIYKVIIEIIEYNIFDNNNQDNEQYEEQ